MPKALARKTAIVTHAARGLGLACAQKLAAEGVQVVLADADATRGRAAARALANAGQSAIFFEADAREIRALEALTAAAIANFGALDVLMSCHGDEFGGADAIAAMIASGRAAAREMAQAGRGGVIVNVAAVQALAAWPDPLARAGVRQLTRAMAAELAAHGICVNAAAPALAHRTSHSEVAGLAVLLVRAGAEGLTGHTYSSLEDAAKVAARVGEA